MPANHQRPAVQTPASPRNTAKYINKDGSKFITVPKGASESSQPSTPTSSKQAEAHPDDQSQDSAPAPAVNRKKQKRRQKAAAKAAAEQAANGHEAATSVPEKPPNTEPENDGPANSEDDDGDDELLGSEPVNGHSDPGAKGRKSKKKKKKGPADAEHLDPHLHVHTDLPHIHTPLASHRPSGISRDKIWSTSNQEERERIKEFWLGLGEDERKSLVKVEKDAVLRKMKEQQKHTCSCSVCGRKRTAIEEELEGLYDAYYVELEQFANQGPTPPLVSSTGDYPFRSIQTGFPPKTPSRGRIVEHVGDDEDDDHDEELEEDYSDDGVEDDEFSDEEPPEEFPHPNDRDMADFLTFGNSLQVKGTQLLESFLRRYGNMDLGGILTVADDLLKNDGKRFIEMMEQLAERRMAREEDARGQQPSRDAGHPNGNYSTPTPTPHANPPPDEDEYEEEEEEDEDYDDSQEDEYEDEEVLSNPSMIPSWSHTECCCQDPMTEEQRMEEGRRMFQIFAARMFEQRVLSAYKEKVAKERQAKLIEELEEEDRKEDEQKAKKAKNAQKKKEKAAQKKQAVAEEKARLAAEKAAEEAERIEAEQRRVDQQRQKAEEKKRQKEAQKKAEEDARLKREAEKQRRLHEQREKQAEQERKAREVKEREKKLKEEQRLKEKEAREHKEHETLERKEKQARDKREKEARAAKAQKEAQEAKEAKERAREERAKEESLLSKGTTQAAPTTAPAAKRAQQPPVSVPTVLPQHPANPASFASPKVPAVTPVLSKAPTPIRSRALSQQHQPQHDLSHQSGQGASQASSATSQAASPLPLSNTSPSPIGPPRRESGSFHSNPLPDPTYATSPPHGPFGRPRISTPVQSLPPLGMQPPPGLGAHQVPPGFSPRLAHDQAVPPGFRQQPMIPPPPGINGLGGRGFSPVPLPPPGFAQTHGGQFPPNQGYPLSHDVPPLPHANHTRQGSASFDAAPGTPTQPIARPAPIGRPGTTPQGKRSKDLDDELEQHLGSRALLEDDEEDAAIPSPVIGSLRNQPPGPQPRGFGSSPFMDTTFGLGHNPWGPPAPAANVFGPPGMSGSTWGVPPVPSAFGVVSPPPPAPSRLHHAGSANPEVRSLLVQCYRDLKNAGQGDPDGYINFYQFKGHVDSQRGDLGEQEIWDIIESEGHRANGGGIFESRLVRGAPALRWSASPAEAPLPRQGPLVNPLLGSTALKGL